MQEVRGNAGGQRILRLLGQRQLCHLGIPCDIGSSRPGRTADVPLTVRPIGRSGQRNECRRELFEAGDARSEVGEWGACDYVVRACGQVRLNRGGDVSA